MSRTLVIGDIHGALKALVQVLDRAKVTTSDHLIFLGDYVDGWSDAAETIAFLIELNKTHRCTFLRGNHDELANNYLENGIDNPNWLHHGGQATVDSYAKIGAQTKKHHITFNKQLKNYYLDSSNRLFVHAGFSNLHGVDQEYFSKTFYWDRTLWEMALALDPLLSKENKKYPPRLKLYKEVYIGHTPVTRIGKTIPVQAVNVWNIDTGAAFKGPLTILDVNTKQFWQSDAAHSFYPNERGRN